MIRVIVRRLLLGIPVLLIVSALTFVLMSLLPGDTATALLGSQASPAQVAKLRLELGLDQPLPLQYWHWLTAALHGDLGFSLLNSQSVVAILNGRLAVTLTLVLLATIVSAVAGVAIGFLSALRGGAVGRVVDFLSFVGLAFPAFWIALLLVAVFAVGLEVLPPNGFTPPDESVGGWIQSLILPIVALAIGGIAGIAAQTRDATLDVLSRDFVRVQLANGFSKRSIVWKHVLRSAAPPVLTVAGLIFVGLMSGAVLIEQIFALPGIGQEVVMATTNRDIPTIQGAVLYLTTVVLVVNLVVDIANGWLNPKVRTR